jgi:hypothetical protein
MREAVTGLGAAPKVNPQLFTLGGTLMSDTYWGNYTQDTNWGGFTDPGATRGSWPGDGQR